MPLAPRTPGIPANQPQPPTQPTTPQTQQPQAPDGYNLPTGPIAEGGRVAHQAMKQLGYVPEWGENPRNIVDAYRVIKATPKDVPLPTWISEQRDQIEQSYNWMQFRNKNAPPEEWKFLPPDDPGRSYLAGLKGPDTKTPEEVAFSQPEKVQDGEAAWTDLSPDERKTILSDKSFDITQYPIPVRDQILNDPAFDWSRVPKWQKTYFSIMSNPKIMASPMALAGANAGGLFGLPGKLVGAAAGYGLGLVGGQQYDPTSGVLDQPTIVAGMMAVLNKLSEGAEQSAGFTAQYLDAAIAGAQGNEQAAAAADKMLTDPAYRKATWEAGRFAYEASDFLGARNWIPGLARLLGDETATLAAGGEDFIIGKAEAVDRAKAKGFNPVTGNFYDVTDSMGILQEARLTIHKAILAGEDPKEVIRQIMGEQSQYVGSTVSDFAGQMVIDPLEHLPNVTAKTTGMIAKLTGNETAARAFSESSAPIEGLRRYKTLVQTGDVPAGFGYTQMGSVSRWAAGLNAEGKITAGPFTQTGLLDRPAKTAGLLAKFKEDLAALTPEARAREGANMFYNNIGSLLTTMSYPAEIVGFLRRVAKTDLRVAADLGNKIANSPEFYTILPALKAFGQDKLTGLLSAWDLAAPKRDALLRVTDILGDSPGSLIEDLAKRGTTEQDFQRIVARLQQADSPEARALLQDIEAGAFTPDNLKDIVDAFSGDGALYWHPDQWKAATMDALGSHFDEWTVDQLQLGKDTPASKAFFRTAHLLKSAQSVLLLGGSPGYALQNGLSGMVHRAATGIYGYMTPGQIDGWLDRFGVTPARLEEGVGIGGVVETAQSRSSVKTEAIQKAVKGNQNDALGKAQRVVSALGKAMPFNKVSSWFEKVEGKNGYMIAMRDMWAQTWRRGKGFAEMTPELRRQVEQAGINPDQIYSLIEAGMNKAEIEKFIFSRQQGMMSRTLVNTAAQKLGIPASSAARLLDKVGVLDELDRTLTKAATPSQVLDSFRNATRKAQDFQDMQTSRDLKAMAEAVTNKVSGEGAPAALDVVQRVNSEYFDAWLDHYSRFGEMFEDLRGIPDEAVRNRAIDLNYKISDQEFRRINARTAANYQGIFAAWGKSRNPRAMEILAAVAQTDSAMKSAYDFMRNTRKQFFDTLRDNPDSLEPGRWEADQKSIDQEFERAFKQKAAAEKQMGEALGAIYEEMYGKAAGEAARKWYEDYTKFSAEIVKREKDFRKSLIGLDKDQRESAKQRFYQGDKVAQIAELERINQEGIARLERVIRRGGDGLAGRTTAPGTPPKGGPGSDEVNSLISDAEARLKEETQAKAERTRSVWDVAEEYARVGLPFNRTILQDRFNLLGALRKEEYGGFPDLKGLDDERLTPDKVRSILDERQKVKEVEDSERADLAEARAEVAREEAEKKAARAGDPKDLTILQAIRAHGGIDISVKDVRSDITGSKTGKGWQPGIFSKKGAKRWSLDDLARILVNEDSYPIDLNSPDDPGGVKQLIDLMQRAQRGEKIYPTTHDYSKEIDAAQAAYIETMQAEAKVDVTEWQRDLETAAETGDLTRVYEMFETLPEEGTAPTGESWTDYASRIADETALRVETEARDQAVADMQSRIDQDTAGMEARGDAAQTKRILEEKFKDVFDLTDEEANAYMEISEALAGWYTRATGESGDAFYTRYYEDIVEGGEGDLFQIEPVNRQMTTEEIGDYARALVRSGADELRRAVVSEPAKADRVAILDAAHKLNPQLAENVARQVSNALFQEMYGQGPKGAVTFDPDGIKATIHAFESKDISTLIHENAHVYRRVLSDVATRTDNKQIRADLATIEEWAGVTDGNWTRDAEEKFARGFERYITEGEAPTPKLKKAFESFKMWMLQVYKQITGSQIDVKLTDEVKEVFDRMLGEEKPEPKVRAERKAAKVIRPEAPRTEKAEAINALFQNANPLGTMEDASGFKADSEWQDAGWKQHVKPLLDAMQETALDKLNNETPLDGAYKDMSAEGQAMLRAYIRQVQNDMGAVKNSTIKWGESQRDFALLNYNRRYGFDRYLETAAPYEFFATRSLMTWAMRGLDKPSWYANYARIRNMQNKHERDEPERLRNKFKIPAPWLPDWMGDALYIDPVGFLFTPANFLRPIERMKQDKTQQVLEAERVLQEWAADGTADEGQIAQASATQSGALWERALAEASVRRESEISNPMDFMASLFGPAWYLSTPLNMLGIEVPGISKGKPEKVTGTPLLNTTRAFETVTKGTWAEPIGQLIGLIGKPEEALRKKAGLPEFGEFGDYYVDRQISNMVAEGLITPDQAQIAMIERQGELFDQARERVKMELAMRVPLAGALYAGTQGGAGDAAKAMLPSMFGAGLLPQGELEYRGLKGEWNAAWKLYDAGDKTAINNFFEEYPEYEAYLAKGKEPKERLRSYLIGNIWDAYMGLGATNQKAARAQMGEDFSRSFLDKETRSYDTLDVTTLTGWAQLLGAMVPKTFEGAPIGEAQPGTPALPTTSQPPQALNLYDDQTTQITDKYFNERKEKYGDYFMLQQGYYSLPPSQRSAYLLKFPRLKEYQDWQKGYYEKYPELKPIFQGKVFKQVDTSLWPPALEEYVSVYAMTGQRLPKGATTALEQIWIREGRPMDDFKTWLNSEVVPAFLYQQGAPQ